MIKNSTSHNIVRVSLVLALFVTCSAIAQTSRVFRDNAYSFSFRHPGDWEPVEAQRSSTRLLLYARDGSEATANVSVVKSDRRSVKELDTAYFEGILSKILSQPHVRGVRYINVLGKDMAIVDASFRAELPSGSFTAKSLMMVTIHKGNRFMLIVNGLPEKFKGPAEAFDLMVGTFAFH